MNNQKKYTAQEMRDFANDINQYGLAGACMGRSGNRDGNTIAAMLRQAADAEEELTKVKASKNRWMQYQETAAGERNACIDELRNKDAEIAQLKARLEAVVKIVASIIPLMKMEYDNHKCSPSAVRCGTVYAVKVEKILRVARGEESAPQ